MLSERIKEIATDSGIDVIGFTDASPFSNYALKDSIRMSPRSSMPEAKSVIVAGIYIGGLTLPCWNDMNYGRTSRLYMSGFFADVVKPLSHVTSFLQNEGYKTITCQSFESSTSILPLKLAAVRAGIGWQGKCSLLVTKKFGTFLALGGIITDAVLDYNTVIDRDRCGKCDRCLQACPTASLNTPYTIEKKTCLAYNLQLPDLLETYNRVAENRVGDCEICQDVCPWNLRHLKNPLPTRFTVDFRERAARWEKLFQLSDLSKIDEDSYRNIFGELNTGIPFAVFRRNVINALEKINNS